ncbi:hypothetical protein IJ670_03555 [bacterium]|nr:hypothetical protein [bacterium]
MAPFPEEENMTIKRLQVALKRGNFELLKDGAYKLHEKFHAGHYFEDIESLKEILEKVSSNYTISPDIKDILIPTIEDILNSQGVELSKVEPQEPELNRVSSLTSLSYDIPNDEKVSVETNVISPTYNEEVFEENKTAENSFINQEEEKKDEQEKQENYEEASLNDKPYKPTFDEFAPIETIIPPHINEGNPSTSIPSFENQNLTSLQEGLELAKTPPEFEEEIKSKEEQPNPSQENTMDKGVNLFNPNEKPPQPAVAPQAPFQNVQEHFQENNTHFQPQQYSAFHTVSQPSFATKSITIFYGQMFSTEKIHNIQRVKNLLKGVVSSDNFVEEISGLMNEIYFQANTNTSELQILLQQLSNKNHKVDVITNSQSADLVNLLENDGIKYSIYERDDDKKFNIIPMFGLTNCFRCTQCQETFVSKNNTIMPYLLQCPKCKGTMYFDLYTPDEEINTEYYNKSLISFANADVWVLLHPLINDKFMFDMLKCAIAISSKVKNVYILDRDINTRETFKRMFGELKPEVNVNTNPDARDNFINSL